MKDLSTKALIFILITIITGALTAMLHLTQAPLVDPWLWVLAGLASVGQVLKVEGATHKSSYNTSWLIYGYTFVSLGTPAMIFVILVAHLVEWAWHKYPWYIQWFNIATFMISGVGAHLAYQVINPSLEPFHLAGALGLLAAMAVFTLLNHLLVGLAIMQARGQSFSQSGVFAFLTLMIDFSLIGMGASTALVWLINPFAIVLSALPIYLMYSTLKVPALQRQTEIDPKTGLYNARFFAEALERELTRADRYDRPLTVVLGDLDLLRNINNTYGHLAGDEVLIGIARILQDEFREYDVVARFGGEEYAILMPESMPEEAYPRIDKVRAAIEAAEFEVPTSITPIQATISFGIAGREYIEQTAEDIIHNADVSLYRAKLQGRNVTCIFSHREVEDLFVKENPLESPPGEITLKDRIGQHAPSYQPNPLREKNAAKNEEAVKQETPAPTSRPRRHKPAPAPQPRKRWVLDAFIGLVVLLGIGGLALLFRSQTQVDWLGLAVFGLIVLVTEGLSIDIYVRETSISTAAAPFIAGVLIFGAPAALVLSLILAGTALVKHRSHISRFFFNSGNHLISSSLVSGLVLLSGTPLTDQHASMQFGLAMVAGMIVFASTTLMIALATSLSMGEPVLKIWKERFFWLWPYYPAFGISAYALLLGYMYAGVIGTLAVLIPLLTLRFSQVHFVDSTKKLVSQLKRKNFELEDFSKEVVSLNEDLLLSLSNVIDLRDTFTRGHSEFVSRYAVLMGQELGLSPARLEQLHKAGMLHDIGKIGIPDTILFKPGPLTDEEYHLVMQHPVRGAELIKRNVALKDIVPIVRHHHERVDGRGYPDGLAGHEIPLEARILGVADAIEAMASDRPYRRALSFEQIIQELRENAGTQFDREVVEAFLRVVAREGDQVTVNSAELLNNPERATVRARNHLGLAPA